MNKITLIGRLTADPELRTTTTGKPVCKFSLAVNRRGENKADFFNVIAWNGTAEVCAKWLKKGRQIAVIGSVALNTYTAKDGTQRANIEVTASDVEFLGNTEKAEKPESKIDDYEDVSIDDLPF